MRVRDATEADLPGILTIYNEVIRTSSAVYTDEEATLEDRRAWLAGRTGLGYPVLVAGTIAEIFGIHIGLYLTIPGFFFELVLPFRLFFKGFQPDAYLGQPGMATAAGR